MIAILKKELRATLREKTGVSLLLSMPALFALFSFFTINSGPAYYQDQMTACDAGRRLLSVGLNTWVFAMMLLLPVLSAVNLVRESERKTLDVLLVTPRSGAELGLAKLLSPVIISGLSALMTLPILMALPLLGGVRPWEPLAGLAAALLTALGCSALGMCAGALMRGTAGAVVGAGLGSWLLLVGTTWPLWASGTGLVGASLPLGVVRLVLQGDEVTLLGRSIPMLLPCLLFLPLAAAALFFGSLGSLTTPYRRQALPTRGFLLAASALMAVFAVLSLPETGLLADADNIACMLLCAAAIAAPGLLVAERLDVDGTLRTQSGTAEDELVARGGPVLRFAASRAGLALLPLAGLLPASSLLVARLGHAGASSARSIELLLAGHVYLLFWTLFCLGCSGLLARRGRPWLEAVAAQLVPLIIGASVVITGDNDVNGLSGPIQSLTLVARNRHDALDTLLLNVAAMAAAAAVALAAAWAIQRRRAAR